MHHNDITVQIKRVLSFFVQKILTKFLHDFSKTMTISWFQNDVQWMKSLNLEKVGLKYRFELRFITFFQEGAHQGGGTKAGRKVVESELTIKFCRYSSAQMVFTFQQSFHRTAFPFCNPCASFQFNPQLCGNYNRTLFANTLMDERWTFSVI